MNELIRDVKVATMTTADEDGLLRARSMVTPRTEFDGVFWFFASRESPRVDEDRQDHRVTINHASNDDSIWVSVSGTAALVRDRTKMEEFWTPVCKAWSPDRLDDPAFALLVVNMAKAEYWDVGSCKMVQLVGFVKALATGEKVRPGDNAKLDLAAV